jgi:tetratricopeptide (TPR) repeat protein
MKLNALLLVMIFLAQIGCNEKSSSIQESEAVVKENGRNNYEALSLFGEPLTRVVPSGSTLARLQRDLTVAIQNVKQDPNNEDNIIWHGRRLAYLSRFKDAIEVYTKGLEMYPKSYRLLRHRGHRYITLRKFSLAIQDLTLAASLVPAAPILMEPDGVPNKINRPLGSTQFNIWYHLGLAYYLTGDFNSAAIAYRKCLELAHNDDSKIAATDWLYMTLTNLGREEEVKTLLDAINDNVVLIENDAYLKRIKMNKGQISPEKLLELKPTSNENATNLATQGYGVGHYFLIKNNRIRAIQVFQKVLETDSWSSFGYIASEVELYRLGERPEVN